MKSLRAALYRINRRILGWWTRPASVGHEKLRDVPGVIYVLQQRATTDLVVLDLVAEREGLPSPRAYLDELSEYFAATATNGASPDTEHDSGSAADAALAERRRFLSLNRTGGRWPGRELSPGLQAVHALSEAHPELPLVLVPVSTLWGRIQPKEGSLAGMLISDHYATTSRIRRFLTLLLYRRDILVEFSDPLPLTELRENTPSPERAAKRSARLLRLRFAAQRKAALGTDLSHQRTLIRQIVTSRAVTDEIERQAAQADNPDRERSRLAKAASKNATSIASAMSYPVIRLFDRFLTRFWNRFYDGVDINGLERVRELAASHTLIYAPCHRSHVDYLLLSYLLHYHGLSLPHIAAGDNLNLPVVGPLLRRGGAFFMRRRFRNDALYSAVFAEYLYQVHRRGHSVEYFIEGGRTRTGRLLPPQTGLLNMTIEAEDRGMPQPVAFLPVNFTYERLLENKSYLDELQRGKKERESLFGLIRTVRRLRHSFGKVTVNFGNPLLLGDFLGEHPERSRRREAATLLGDELARRINACAHVSPIHLIALVTLGTPRLAMAESDCRDQIGSLQRLLARRPPGAEYTVTDLAPAAIIEYAADLEMAERDSTAAGDFVGHAPVAAVLLTWYRNNVLHLLALPSLIACLLANRQRGLAEDELVRRVDIVFPYLCAELWIRADPGGQRARHWLDVMVAEGLIRRDAERNYLPPRGDAGAQHRLRILSKIIMQTLERLYIVLSVLDQALSEPLTRKTLERGCQRLAQRMARLYGLNAPEFFDERLIRQFVSNLLSEEVVATDDDGRLQPDPLIARVLRAADSVLDPEFRLAVRRGK
ncbi:MAG: glycerol-3-phosphate 1-O-acyltransferase PlsB [Pseudomonadota bacterium]